MKAIKTMKGTLTFLALGTAGLWVWGFPAKGTTQSAAGTTAVAAAQPSSGRVPVLVELFTSEGCSSCPPADALLTDMDKRQPFPTVDVIAIEEHVDYWDQQGWKDPFSSPDWTYRQNDYAAVLHTGSPYTPEMVVDGTQGFTGSRGPLAKAAVEKAASEKKAAVEVSEVSPPQGKSVTLKIGVGQLFNAAPKDTAQVLLAITETGLHVAVKDGENAGHELQHSAVLREMKLIGVVGKNGQEFSAQPTVKFDSDWKLANLRAVVFVQEKKSRRVLGAAELPLEQEQALR
jgi:hypothetical protein